MLLGGMDELGEQLFVRLREAESVDIWCCRSEERPRVKISHKSAITTHAKA